MVLHQRPVVMLGQHVADLVQPGAIVTHGCRNRLELQSHLILIDCTAVGVLLTTGLFCQHVCLRH
jgi:hypothetical protein